MCLFFLTIFKANPRLPCDGEAAGGNMSRFVETKLDGVQIPETYQLPWGGQDDIPAQFYINEIYVFSDNYANM